MKILLKKLLIPYILWSIFYSVLNSPNGFNPIEIIYNLITGRAQAQLYYILVLVELTLLTPLLMKAVDNKKMSVLILSITPVYLLLTTGYRYITGNELSWMGRDFCAWLIFYYFGLLVKHYDWKRRNNYFLYVLYIIALIFSVVEGLLANSLEMFSLAISQVKISSMLYSLAAIALIMNRWLILKDRKLYQKSRKSAPPGFIGKIIHSLVYIGDISFGIYFCHTLVLKCVTFVWERIGVMEIFSLPFIQLLQFFLTLILSVIGIIIVQKIDKKRKLCPYIGF